MKNKFLALIILVIGFTPALAENLNIKSYNVTIDKKTSVTVFKDNVVARDGKNNTFKTSYAEYDKNLKLLKSKGKTSILTSEGFFLDGSNITFDNKNKIIISNDPALIKDLENNNIFLDNFEYSTANGFFKSTGNIKVVDSKNNSYNFSQIFIDEKKREIVGSDVKTFLNDREFKINSDNKPRIFSNTVKIKNDESQFAKSIFTLCDYRENDKCPPWSIQANEMRHDKKTKTIYYDKAVLKVYDVPLFFFPKLSHPDPTVDRRSGFLPPSFSSSKNLGRGFHLPYFWDINKDKDLTFTSKVFNSEHPLFLGEYRQAFKASDLILDFGYTKGYKNTTATKVGGDKSHFFSRFTKNFKGKNNSNNNFELGTQHVSNDKYLKLYNLNTKLAKDRSALDYEVLENYLDFTHEDRNLFFGFTASAYENLKDNTNDKYEYILPEVIVDKNLFSSAKFGAADLQSSLKFQQFDTNKTKKYFINDINWKSNKFNYSSGLQGRLLGKVKNVNYETNNVELYKKDTTNELFGALGYLSEIDLYKKTNNKKIHNLTPKILFRYSPNHMRKAHKDNNIRSNNLNLFSLDRLGSYDNFESGANATIGFNYKTENEGKILDFEVGQIINEKENKKMPSTSSLDEKLSDVIGNTNFKYNDNIEFKYNFALDQSYKQLNYNEIGTKLTTDKINFDFDYLQEKEHLGNQEYFRFNAELTNKDNSIVSLETKRNLITNSSEYYSLSYEYLNDCLKAGLVYRREFYNDSEIEAGNTLMFKITLIPFGDLNNPITQ